MGNLKFSKVTGINRHIAQEMANTATRSERSAFRQDSQYLELNSSILNKISDLWASMTRIRSCVASYYKRLLNMQTTCQKESSRVQHASDAEVLIIRTPDTNHCAVVLNQFQKKQAHTERSQYRS